MQKNCSQAELISWFEQNAIAIVQATFSAPQDAASETKKVTLRPIYLKDKPYLQIVFFEKTRSITKNVALDQIRETIHSQLNSYQNIFIRLPTEEIQVSQASADHYRIKKNTLAEPIKPQVSHNRKKQYLIEEGAPVQALVELGIMTCEGKVKPDSRAKFKQINRFLELVLDVMPHFSKKQKVHIVDMGCGKAYLSFALYHLLSTSSKQEITIIGVDLKKDVVEYCNGLAKKLNYTGLSFVYGSISDFVPELPVDIVIALHACDVASDAAIAQAVSWEAEALFIAPCCQHELNSQLKTSAFPLLLTHGLFRERFAALLTDALRVELLETIGYKTDVCEFVDPVHTPKNLLIRALKKQTSKNELSEEYKKIVREFGIKPTLEKLLFAKV